MVDEAEGDDGRQAWLLQLSYCLQRFLRSLELDSVKILYDIQYEVTHGIYTLTPGEKAVANAFVGAVLLLLIGTTLIYFPLMLYRKLSRLIWLLTGHSGEEMRRAVWNNVYVADKLHGEL